MDVVHLELADAVVEARVEQVHEVDQLGNVIELETKVREGSFEECNDIDEVVRQRSGDRGGPGKKRWSGAGN